MSETVNPMTRKKPLTSARRAAALAKIERLKHVMLRLFVRGALIDLGIEIRDLGRGGFPFLVQRSRLDDDMGGARWVNDDGTTAELRCGVLAAVKALIEGRIRSAGGLQ